MAMIIYLSMGTNYYITIVDKSGDDIRLHIGKRSGGWDFCWDHNDWKYYKDVSQLLAFLLTGTIDSENENDLPVKLFLSMALNWTGKVALDDVVIHGFRFSQYTGFS
jgi:hypothetical protein